MKQTEIDFAKKATDEAIQRGVDHANAVHSNWSDQAFEFLKGYAEINPIFMVEDVRNASKGVVPSPPTDKAWGGVIRKAAFNGIVFRAGYREVKNVRAHRTPASVWKSTIVKY
jgi:hypothetical protein